MQKKIHANWQASLILFVLFLFGVFGVVWAQREGFGYTEITFLTGGSAEVSYLQMTVTGGSTANFSVKIVNPTDQDQTVMLDFFDQVLTNDGENKKACDRIHTVNDFASTLLWNTGSFVIPANSGVSRVVNLNYGYCSSGLDLGCVVQMPTGMVDAGSFDVSLGKANFLDLQINQDAINCGKYTVKALPSFRQGSFDLSGFIGLRINDDFAVMTGNNASVTSQIVFSSDGVSSFVYDFPHNGSGYMALLKVPSYLSVGYTGIFDANITGSVDFTLFVNLDNFVYSSGWFDKVFMIDLPEVQGFSGEKSLLVAGDVNENDYIGASDLALINSHLTVSFAPVDGSYDFDKNDYITSKDQAIMIQNVQRNGFWRNFKNILSSGYLTGDDVQAGNGEFPRMN